MSEGTREGAFRYATYRSATLKSAAVYGAVFDVFRLRRPLVRIPSQDNPNEIRGFSVSEYGGLIPLGFTQFPENCQSVVMMMWDTIFFPDSIVVSFPFQNRSIFNRRRTQKRKNDKKYALCDGIISRKAQNRMYFVCIRIFSTTLSVIHNSHGRFLIYPQTSGSITAAQRLPNGKTLCCNRVSLNFLRSRAPDVSQIPAQSFAGIMPDYDVPV